MSAPPPEHDDENGLTFKGIAIGILIGTALWAVILYFAGAFE